MSTQSRCHRPNHMLTRSHWTSSKCKPSENAFSTCRLGGMKPRIVSCRRCLSWGRHFGERSFVTCGCLCCFVRLPTTADSTIAALEIHSAGF
ncbi:hypothetical protein PAXINDRAFT_183022 [Paxillus involutus ATCC 200175]|uniref:Uncharacterized protein n=1 Tax=Paxillus involutus ATCC 200175 TaxID=664439 RepID=A0A0C9SLS7_PAXIN|nr:hypothetical protein PAXINDRAFT_183022 [Paxillus involutus ATCC 200175]